MTTIIQEMRFSEKLSSSYSNCTMTMTLVYLCDVFAFGLLGHCQLCYNNMGPGYTVTDDSDDYLFQYEREREREREGEGEREI